MNLLSSMAVQALPGTKEIFTFCEDMSPADAVSFECLAGAWEAGAQ